MKTHEVKKDEINRKWYLIDAKNKTLGRLCTRVAHMLQGKHKPDYSDNLDTGDNVILINAADIRLTGNKAQQKSYFSASSYPGNSKFTSYEKAVIKDPAFPLVHAVKGMLPKNSRGRNMINKLHVYAGGNHPHAAQKPETIQF